MVTMSNSELAKEYFRKAYSSQVNGKTIEAIINYRISIQLNPSPQAYTNLGYVLGAEGKYEEAIRNCKLAIELDKEFGVPYTEIGYFLMKLGDIENSIVWLLKAIRIFNNDEKHKAYYYLGKIYLKKSEWQKAISCFQDSLRAKPDYQPAKNEFYKVVASLN